MSIFEDKVLRRKLKRILSQPRIWFIIVVYPLLTLVFGLAKAYLTSAVLTWPLVAGLAVWAICAFISLSTVWSILVRLFKRDYQGSKLRIRERQGIELSKDH
ncbi:MAG: hypothetical protein FWE76_01970 [Symbiobacteriaceae bacterium]|nr:hypothetical protein [Symbiobacteriaceae bacterium]